MSKILSTETIEAIDRRVAAIRTERRLADKLLEARYCISDYPPDAIDDCLRRAEGMADLIAFVADCDEVRKTPGRNVASAAEAVAQEIRNALVLFHHYWESCGAEAWKAHRAEATGEGAA
jgi:hypothetical protein